MTIAQKSKYIVKDKNVNILEETDGDKKDRLQKIKSTFDSAKMKKYNDLEEEE